MMTESKMAKVAKLLGVRIGEIFKIRAGTSANAKVVGDYFFNEDGLCWNDEAHPCPAVLNCLLNGVHEVVKLPWKPQKNEGYYTFATTPYGCYAIVCAKWHNTFNDKMRYRNGFCYKTIEEANADESRAHKFFASDERIIWEDCDED